MAIYELRTYEVIPGKMAEIIELYRTEGYAAISGHPPKLVGYFTGDVGAINELIHIWKFDDDADRRAFWNGVFTDPKFMAFAKKVRPLFVSQKNKLMLPAGWGPQTRRNRAQCRRHRSAGRHGALTAWSAAGRCPRCTPRAGVPGGCDRGK